MKRRIVCACLFILYLLAICMLLSFKIEEEMQTQVFIQKVNLNPKSGGMYSVPLDCVFERDPENLLCELTPGTGWREGLYITLVNGEEYGLDGRTNTATLISQRDRQIVRHASRFPVPGEKGVAVKQTSIEDQYLLIYPDRMPPFENHWEGVSLLEEGTYTRLLNVADAPDPFLGDQAREKLYQIQSPEWQIYSLHAAANFLEALPPLALLAGILWIMLILGIHSCVLIGKPEEHRRILIWNIRVEGLLLLVLLLVLYGIDLPASLLPPKSILDFGYYHAEFTTIFKALEDLGQQLPIHALKDFVTEQAQKILFIGTVAPLLWIWMWKEGPNLELYSNNV